MICGSYEVLIEEFNLIVLYFRPSTIYISKKALGQNTIFSIFKLFIIKFKNK